MLESRNATASAISAGLAISPSRMPVRYTPGLPSIDAWSARSWSLQSAESIGVSVEPGVTRAPRR
ncbi:hypothetical protein [Sphaerisporangium sp. NPDC051011]|uniref:hypothetical protein n=1 Tax=Sphaerisporangium sp. NPDC051011 TaxID=3155792 RepID=UPI0034021755